MELLFIILFVVLVFSGPDGVIGLISGLFSFLINFAWFICVLVGALAVYWLFTVGG